MLTENILNLYKKFRLKNYRELFSRIREKPGSLSATEAFAVDVIYLLGHPTVTQLADTLGISQPNATYKVNNLVAKGYVSKSTSEDDRRECRLSVAERFYSYYDIRVPFLTDAVEKLKAQFTASELETFRRVLAALDEAMD